MKALSKSKLLAYRQCAKRLWLEVHRPELLADSSQAQARFTVGHRVGEVARKIYDPKGKGTLIDVDQEGYAGALARSAELFVSGHPIFEAGLSADGALAFADVMLPVRRLGKKLWRIIEVKSSTRVKAYHRDDIAIQAFVAKRAGVPLAGVSLAHIDSSWVYHGGDDYAGLLVENDLTEEAFARDGEVSDWIGSAQTIVAKPREPRIGTGRHCTEPYECGFLGYCKSREKQANHPISWLPGRLTKAARARIEEDGVTDLRDMPDELLNDLQRRVKTHTLSGETFFDAAGAAAALSTHKLPAYFLDFETIQFAVPSWKGTRPYQMIPFQFSVHRLSRRGSLDHQSFLDLSGEDPSKPFVSALLAACGEREPVFVYNAGFEKARISELADRFPRLRQPLLSISARIVDLLPVAREHYYHPDQQGSWSIKAVLPTVMSDSGYDALDGVQDGGMAMEAYLEAIHPETETKRSEEIYRQLSEYCCLDTYALVRLWQIFAGHNELAL